MSYLPSSRGLVPSVFLSPMSRESLGEWWGAYRLAAPSSGVWSATNRAFYIPFWLERGVIVYRLWWLNGTVVGTDNRQAGIYRDDSTSVVLGTSTLVAGANVVQFDDIADTALGPGKYFMALWGNGITATVFRVVTANATRNAGYFMESSLTGGLPATATMAQLSVEFLPVFGLALRSTP